MISDYQEAWSWLLSLLHCGIKLGLHQTRRLAELCGSPEQGLRFIHLAGTNGKGSTGAMLERALRENKFKTGFFSSPHLISACERIRINGRAVSDEDLAAAAQQVKEAVAVGADIIMLDNMTIVEMKEAVEYINRRAIVEASGNVNLQTVNSIASTGVDIISSSAIVAKAPTLDLALDM